MFRLLIVINFILINNVWSETVILDDFSAKNQLQWTYISDKVMGGVSEGKLAFLQDEQGAYAKLSGQVSTQNNGGFIQFRTDLKNIDKGFQGIYAKVKGNDQQYFIHLRTRGTILPWQYYQSGFTAGEEWKIIKLPMNSFMPSSKWLKKTIGSSSIRSVGLVAFGRDHSANLEVSEIGFY